MTLVLIGEANFSMEQAEVEVYGLDFSVYDVRSSGSSNGNHPLCKTGEER